jgi:hypothetical protein
LQPRARKGGSSAQRVRARTPCCCRPRGHASPTQCGGRRGRLCVLARTRASLPRPAPPPRLVLLRSLRSTRHN